ncbi:MAG: hypothetical protein ABIS59_00065 [Candidatus Saccharibacteria bacterium]
MAFSDYQHTYSWQAAMELGPKLTMLAEELPSAEQNGLGQALLNLALDLPTAIAIDIQSGSNTRHSILIKLQTALELTGRIYPALDNGLVQNALAERIDRFTGDNFAEAIPAPVPHEEATEESHEAQNPVDPAVFVATAPQEVAPQIDHSFTQAPQPQPMIQPQVAAPINQPDTSGTHISLTPTDQP